MVKSELAALVSRPFVQCGHDGAWPSILGHYHAARILDPGSRDVSIRRLKDGALVNNTFRFFVLLLMAANAFGQETNPVAPASVLTNVTDGSVSNVPAASSITIDGTTYEEFRWGRVTPATVTIFHKTGVAAIPLGRLPPELQVKFGYDPVKAQQYRVTEAKAIAAWEQATRQRIQRLQQQQAEGDRVNRLKATAADFHCKIVALDPKGVIVRTRVDGVPVPQPPGVSAAESPVTRATQSEIEYGLLVGHPRQASLAVGATISCRAYRDGVQETDGEPIPRWVYIGEALHPILPPPPP